MRHPVGGGGWGVGMVGGVGDPMASAMFSL